MTEKLAFKQSDGQAVNNWYIACLSSELKNKPIRRIVYGEPYVLYRDQQGQVICHIDRCPHRHSTLSDGHVQDGYIVCSYHGWQFDGTGKVTHIPSEGPNTTPQKNLCVKNIPCVEQDFAIWIWTGDIAHQTEAPPWKFPNYDRPNWYNYCMITDFEGEVTDLCENFMDVPHTVFVHAAWFRDQKNMENKMRVEVKNARVLITYLQEKDEFSWGARMLLNPHGAPMKHTDEYIYPNITCVRYDFEPCGFIINSQCTPMGPLKTRVYTYIAYSIPYVGRFMKPILNFYTRKVINQDVDIMQIQAKNLKMDPTRIYHSTPADEVHKSIERIRHYGETGSDQLFSFQSSKEVSFWI